MEILGSQILRFETGWRSLLKANEFDIYGAIYGFKAKKLRARYLGAW